MRSTRSPIVFLAALAACMLGLPASALAHHPQSTAVATAPASCAGAADPSLTPARVITGEFDTSLERGYVLLPFIVNPGSTAVRVRYCYDQPEAPTSSNIKHVLDLGLYEARPAPGALWGTSEFRGWGGSSHPDVTVSRNGFSNEGQYLTNPKLHRQGRTTRGFLPGPIPAGEWAVELGVAAVASQLEGDSDGKVAWRVEIETSADPLWEQEPYLPAPYDETPARSAPGWYAGDFHVHAEHSSLGDATMREAFGYAFSPLARDCGDGCAMPGAGLDFVTLSDYVTSSAWGEVGRHQADHPGKLIMRSSEVITYQGHANNHASHTYVDYRTGPVYERHEDGTVEQRRLPRPASEIFDAVRAVGGLTQINHPTIFPSEVPGFDFLCRGCPWDYTDADTDYSKVDAIEIATGPAGLQQDPNPGPNPFTPLAVQFWEDAIDSGGLNSNHIAAVGSSDSHNAGRTPDPVIQAPIGTATTVVYAPELSEAGIAQGVRAGHTYVKLFGNDGPDLRFEARPAGSNGPPAIMGDTISGQAAELTARVIGAGPGAARAGDYELFLLKDGKPLAAVPVAQDDFTVTFPAVAAGRYRLQLQRGSAIEAVSSPIYFQSTIAPHDHPAGASPHHIELVPTFRETISATQCQARGGTTSQHGAPFAFTSCEPPAYLPGTAARLGERAVSAVDVTAIEGNILLPGDQADAAVQVSADDVRSTAGADYDPSPFGPDITLTTRWRLSDNFNGPNGDQSGTMIDLDFPIPVTCSPTSDPAAGSSCAANTSVDATVPNAIKEAKSTVIQTFRARLVDAGANATPGDVDDRDFAQQGIYVP